MIMPFVLGKNIPELFNAYMNKTFKKEQTEIIEKIKLFNTPMIYS